MTIRELANKCVFIRCNECKHHKECDEFMKTHIMTPGSYLPYMDVNWDADIVVKETVCPYPSCPFCKEDKDDELLELIESFIEQSDACL